MASITWTVSLAFILDRLREMLRLTKERLRATPFTTMASSRSKLLSRKREKRKIILQDKAAIQSESKRLK
jgi:hypothetical protein